MRLLQARLPAREVRAAVGHFQAAVAEFQKRNWDDATAKTGKFVEAVMKGLANHAGVAVPKGRRFSVDGHINALAASSADDTVRLTIPRACRFIYEVASNRGARHDPDEVDPSEMDATVSVNLSAWVMAELLRYAQRGRDLAQAGALVGSLIQRRYPFVEEVDGRVYFHIRDSSAREIALLTLWHKHPQRVPRAEVIEAVTRHGFTQNNAKVAVARLRATVDDDGRGNLRLLAPGLREAEGLIEQAGGRQR